MNVYIAIKLGEMQINELKIKCPRQFKEDLKTHKIQKDKNIILCDFQGKIKDIKHYLDNGCDLKNTMLHLINNMLFHFNLVINNVKSLKDIIKDLGSKKVQINALILKMNYNYSILKKQ
ncbi:hypothetical protein RFI_22224 [Reticulomyxa filosa]|uniref:Uncharacterized protein n=1 Tax=Reticulomyxa filosa TaxID=46433 RepID=X6MN90_RETFI|nr:hypothetical protein RFI_22224 [Reticulomyxa filosa]|eukprot:ETO15141.1 hypothetical protein RFI_22224 [Reticulomyxa filosa]